MRISSLVAGLLLTALIFGYGQEKFLGNVFRGYMEPPKFREYWNQVTPENAGKWGSIAISREIWFWGLLDAIYEYAKEQSFIFKFHTLVWGQQQPLWLVDLSPEEQRAEIERWFKTVAERYPSIDLIDVVNEPLHSSPLYKEALGGEGVSGWDWVITAFELARTFFPQSKLLINEYGVISNPTEAQSYAHLVQLLKSRGLVDGVGIQCHAFEMDYVDLATMRVCLEILAATGLPLYVSELDISGDDQTQLRRYQEKFPVLWEHPNVVGVTLWGYVQGQMWTENAYLLRVDGTERPALTWLMEYVRRRHE
ncbi:MAG: endo-1,4-beta-xylanase [Candidatus Bipolaricaulota bacterium]|nr:endo-1,4-beta-xylanase [Candidatus Bipolaricaulota bacterium]MDW8126156.1 endo-1,4-beta-xylanase [Candidatus Bipolaricaulota bacterium]